MKTSSATTKSLSPGVKFFVTRIFPLIFMAVGAITVYFGIRGLVRAKASVDWPSTEGRIVESSVDRRRDNDGDTTYHAEVLYEFTVNGITFNGNRVAYGDYGSSSPTHARRIVNRYPKDTAVTVHYMADDPEEAVLEPGIKGQAWFLPGFGFVFFAAGSLMFVFLPRALKKQEATGENAKDGEQSSGARQSRPLR